MTLRNIACEISHQSSVVNQVMICQLTISSVNNTVQYYSLFIKNLNWLTFLNFHSNFQTSCHETRKRKETELEMLTGTIEGWGEEVICELNVLF